MRVLVLGGDGMLGHELAGTLADHHDVAVTVRGAGRLPAAPGALPGDRIVTGIDARCHDDVADLLDRFRPDAVLNAIGLVKQRSEGQTALPAVEINTIFPHRLARLCRIANIRLVHVSTDCVFSGRRGRYTEDDQPDPVDVYGMSKLLGEVREAPALTLRTSIIGLELAGRASGLVEWFLGRSGQVSGYQRAVYTGLTTMEIARLLDRILTKHEDLTGLWHVAAPEPITKFDLLVRLSERLRAAGRPAAEVVAIDGPPCDRSLLADRFAAATGYTAPGWDSMLDELAERIMLRDHGGRSDD
ncbi:MULTISPECIES: dTDP-4-dehydrorhamnose reductase family protein [Pseudofrankia]|uniref:dTDP-4-dehydrorhamnose reductase family protein n=1 Tax=Pseudofrankia TaxID=2994363 RepID=UPI000234C7CB|nr:MULTISPECIES: SDR family oxidoreductase [Pseudofrankia]OHV39958.1 NAD(P)-dependent oxidoreductase [Pseudofrankia sp. EUN1h]